MNNLQTFSYESAKIRAVDVNGEPWFIAKDVCDAINIADPSQAAERLDEDERLMRTIYVSGQGRKTLMVNESGLYALIIRSNKEEAKSFRKWITSEVMPSIRKTGSYSLPAGIDQKSKEIRNGITDIWKERGAEKWDYKNLTFAEYKVLGYQNVSKVKKENMSRIEKAKLAGLEMFETLKLEKNENITGYHALKDSVIETGAAIDTALGYIESRCQVRAS